MSVRRVWALAALIPVLAAADASSGLLAGRSLADALGVVQSRGVKVIFSTNLVRVDMRVAREPRATRPRELLDELLRPHGLTVRPGPEDSWLVVRAAESPAALGSAAPASADESPPSARFQDTVDVTSGDDGEHAPLAIAAVQVGATAGGLENVFHTLQLLPGITPVQEIGSRLAVRGGGPDQNLIVMDGVEVQNPYRMFGVVSGINPETVDRFELFTGAFSARYGDRLSSLLVIDTRNGSSARGFQGLANVNLTDSSVLLEGRLPGGRPASSLVAARRTYYDLVAERLTAGDMPGFTDGQFKGTWEPWSGQRLTLQALVTRESGNFSSLDEVEGFADNFGTRTTAPLVAAIWDGALGPHAQLRSTLSFSKLKTEFLFDARVCSGLRRSNSRRSEATCAQLTTEQNLTSRDLGLREELAWRVAARHALATGFEVRGVSSGLRLAPGVDLGISFPAGLGLPAIGLPWHDHPEPFESVLAGRRLAAWVEDRISAAGRLSVVAGLRLDHVTSTAETVVAPRFGATYALRPTTRITAGAGVHYQSPGYEKLFIGGTAALDLATPGPAPLRSERALQGVLGFEHDFRRGVGLRVEAYRRRFDRLIVGRLENEDEREARVARYDFPADLQGEIPSAALITRFATSGGEGRASGLELLVSKKATSATTRLTGWVSYSYGSARRSAYGTEYAFDYDRRHAFSLVGQLQPRPWLTLSASAQVASGMPVTLARTASVVAVEDVDDLDRDGDRREWIPSRDALGLLVYEPNYGGREAVNGARLPGMARVDFRAAFQPHGAKGRWLFYLDVINLFNQRNSTFAISSLDFDPNAERPRVKADFVGGFPILPTFGVKFRF